MKKIVSSIIAATFITGSAMAQTVSVDSAPVPAFTATAPVTTTQTYTFDLDRTTDTTIVPLPSGAADYEAATPGEVQTVQSITFDLK